MGEKVCFFGGLWDIFGGFFLNKILREGDIFALSLGLGGDSGMMIVRFPRVTVCSFTVGWVMAVIVASPWRFVSPFVLRSATAAL